ncbi:DNA cytosine methyltransferase [Ancylobacter sp. MQZ15Z-1]|uniref:DNA (cytosine-5-)-methyltransferase n=1 Tax=Ancylobacter mangrovi TaxID=2972472 RepID=A0A9X2PG68_9HYPH|nr:DNA cytosine methyltransferase [Ancylobacter mangrovi]MCS0495588.1 DNA cytosine methyltransferase [Ancylobacter mangrovi]
MSVERALKAIDLYSGIGGWSLGLRLAGIEVVASYERWGPANETNFKNNHHQAQTVDIRRLSFADLPGGIDVVVGSPPCTEFSFSNRGGNGDLEDGLEDIITFLKIVDHLKPRMWAMENVPRVAAIIDKEMKDGGRLHAFSHLGIRPHILNMEDFGLPQRRKRCVAGNFDMNLLQAYVPRLDRSTLGDVITALSQDPVRDPLYGVSLPKSQLVDHVPEMPLNPEELRINRANKRAHVVYNAMPFPDPMERAVRTITATCTRVSRESIVINPPEEPESVRRLTVRERASLQGFPITFQFYGATYGQKLRMVGNAIPPAFSYLMGHVFQGTEAEVLPVLSSHSERLSAPKPMPVLTPPHQPGSTYPSHRSFRFAIQSLQLKSGVRFELRNRIVDSTADWAVDFYFGTSKDIIAVPMDGALLIRLLKVVTTGLRPKVEAVLSGVSTYVTEADIENMQRVWTHRGVGGTRPFMLLDELDRAGTRLIEVLQPEPMVAAAVVDAAISLVFGDDKPLVGLAKLVRNAPLIAAGLLVGSTVNSTIRARVRSTAGRSAIARSH